jgi:sugar lactone lactonase YvrE
MRVTFPKMEPMTTPTSLPSAPSWIVTPDVSLQVNSVALSDDGNCCVFGTSNEFSTGQFAVYCYDGAGQLRWSSPVGAPASTQGVFWVAASADGQFAAAGGETSKTAGFLSAYRVADGAEVLNVTTGYRINQVALSGDGSLLLAVYNDTVQLYSYNGSAYVLASQQTLAGSYCNSCALSPDGFTAAVSCTIYSDSGGASTGQVVSLAIDNQKLIVSGAWASPVGVMRVAVAATGNYWGASLHDGSCALFSPANITTPLWQYKPGIANLSVAYGFDITETAAGRVVLACGANLYTTPSTGYLYLVESVASGSTQAPQFCWGATLAYSANPGVSLDREARYVTATDGQPGDETPGQVSESAGNFYLVDGASGAQLWQYATPVMNWPMVITPDGSHAFGGSDDGSVYFWGSAPA